MNQESEEPEALIRFRYETKDPYIYQGVSDHDLDNLINSCDDIDHCSKENREYFREYQRSFKWIYPHDPLWSEWLTLITEKDENV